MRVPLEHETQRAKADAARHQQNNARFAHQRAGALHDAREHVAGRADHEAADKHPERGRDIDATDLRTQIAEHDCPDDDGNIPARAAEQHCEREPAGKHRDPSGPGRHRKRQITERDPAEKRTNLSRRDGTERELQQGRERAHHACGA